MKIKTLTILHAINIIYFAFIAVKNIAKSFAFSRYSILFAGFAYGTC